MIPLPGWWRIRARSMKADMGWVVSTFISQRGAVSKEKERLRRSRRKACRKRPALIGCDSPLRFAARFSSRRLPGASLPELLQIRLIAAKNVALCLLDIGNAYRVSGARLRAFAVATILPKSPVAPRRRCAWLVVI